MTPIDFEAWQKTKAELQSALRHLNESLTPADRSLLNDLIENNEYGVALDLMDSIVSERSLPLSPEAQRCLSALRAALQ